MTIQSTPITASYYHSWEWNGGINLQTSNGEFFCSKCGKVVDADYYLQPEHDDEPNCPVLYSKPEFFKKSKYLLLLALIIELFILFI